MTQTVPATAQLGPGLTGLTIGLRVLNLDGTTYSAFSTTGVAETSVLGTYRKASGAIVPDAGGYIVWGTAGTDYAEATVDSAIVASVTGNVGGNVLGTVLLAPAQGAVEFVGQVKITANVSGQGALHVRNNHASGHGVDVLSYNGLVVEGTNIGAKLQGGTNQALYMLSDTAAATIYIEGPTTGGKGIAISSPSDGSPGTTNPSGIYIYTEGGHPGIVFNMDDPAPAIKVIGSEIGNYDFDDLLTYAAASEPADVWAYASRTLTALPAATTDGTTAGAITRRRGDSWSISLTVGAITGYTSLWITVKSSTGDADTAAILMIKKNASALSDGLLYVNGAVPADATKASITVSNAATGAIVIAVDETITDDLTPAEYVYDVQALVSGTVSTLDTGTFTVTADVTRAVT